MDCGGCFGKRQKFDICDNVALLVLVAMLVHSRSGLVVDGRRVEVEPRNGSAIGRQSKMTEWVT